MPKHSRTGSGAPPIHMHNSQTASAPSEGNAPLMVIPVSSARADRTDANMQDSAPATGTVADGGNALDPNPADIFARMTRSRAKKLGRKLRHRNKDSYGAAVSEYIDYSLGHLPILKAVSDALWDKIDREPSLTTRTVYIGSRLKQVRSAGAKMRRLKSGLDGMQDIAGCRVVVPDLWDQAVVTELARATFKVKTHHDYRKESIDGYRGHHLVLEAFANKDSTGVCWPPRAAVELQVRTELQDLWANVSELHGKYAATDTKSLKTLSDTLWYLDQLRLAMRVSDEEQDLLTITKDTGSGIDTILRLDTLLNRHRNEGLPALLSYQSVDSIGMIPLDSVLSRHNDMSHRIYKDELEALDEILNIAFHCLRSYTYAERRLSLVLTRGYKPRKPLRKSIRRIARLSKLLIDKRHDLQRRIGAFSAKTRWIDCLPAIKHKVKGRTGTTTPQSQLSNATLEDGAFSMFGLVRSYVLVTAMWPPLLTAMRDLSELAEKRIELWKNDTHQGLPREMKYWKETASRIRLLLEDYAGLSDDPAIRDLRARIHGIRGHLTGLMKLRKEMATGSLDSRRDSIQQWIANRRKVGGDKKMGPEDLKREIRTQRMRDYGLFLMALRSNSVTEELNGWHINWDALRFQRFLGGLSQTRSSDERREREGKFCIVVKMDKDRVGEVVEECNDIRLIGEALRRVTTLERIANGEAILLYADPRDHKVDTHLRYFLDADAMVKRIMERKRDSDTEE